MSINVNVGNIIPTNVVEVGNEISADQLAAITAADSPSATNPFATASHLHTIANISGLQTALDGKAGLSHTHDIVNITGLETALSNKAGIVHSHVINDIESLQVELDGKALLIHSHAISDVTGLQTALDGKANTAHTHIISDVTGLQVALDGKSSTTHTHIIGDVTGLQTALDGKSSTTHTHTQYALTSHTHIIGDITGLQTELDGKSSTTHTHTQYALLTGATFSGEIETPSIGNLLNAELIIDSYNDTGAGTHYYHKFTPYDGKFVLAPNGGGLVFPDTTIQNTAAYSKAQSDAYIATVATWVDTKASKSGDTFTGKVTFTPSAGGNSGINIGTGGTSAGSILAGDLWLATGGTNLNYRDATGAWRVLVTNNQTYTFSSPQIIDTTSTTAGLRVTQKGTGHALVVEDSTSPDSTPFFVNASGQTVIGGIAPANSSVGLTVANGVYLLSGANGAHYIEGGLQLGSQTTSTNNTSINPDYPYELAIVINGQTAYIPFRY